MKVFKNVRIRGEQTDLTVEGGRIIAIGKSDRPGEDFGGMRMYPGLIDVHSHGCIGYDTMEGNLQQMARWECAHGITTWYPTSMTMSREDIMRATSADLTAPQDGAFMPGFHMEGPFINPKYKGAQNESFILPPDLPFFRACGDKIKLVTIAPEMPGSEEFIRGCGAVVCVGHTDADYETVCRAADAGAKCLTHTFNAMPGIHHRKPGPIPAGMDRGMYAQLICDGKHVAAPVVRMLRSMYTTERTVLISDSMRATGLGDGVYSFGGQTITVREGTALTEDGHLAGSTTNLFDCVRTAISFGIPEEDAVRMASEVPAAMMGLTDRGRIAPAMVADLIAVDEDFRLRAVITAGEVRYRY